MSRNIAIIYLSLTLINDIGVILVTAKAQKVGVRCLTLRNNHLCIITSNGNIALYVIGIIIFHFFIEIEIKLDDHV